MNFLLTQMLQLRYFMPLIIEGNKRGIKSTLWYSNVKKDYADPFGHLAYLKALAEEFGFNLSKSASWKGLTFLPDGRWARGMLPEPTYKVVLTQIADFWRPCNYKAYVHEVDNVLFISKFFAEHYDCLSDKNLYLGSPKYDVEFDVSQIRQKYAIGGQKVALFISPHPLYKSNLNQDEVYNSLKSMGYMVIVKSLNKFRTASKVRDIYFIKGDMYFEEASWFPHITLELISVADVVINTDSTTIKECVMLDTPLVNFNVKREDTSGNRRVAIYMDFLANGYAYHKTLVDTTTHDEFSEAICQVTSGDYSDQFEDARRKYLSNNKYCAAAILDYFSDQI